MLLIYKKNPGTSLCLVIYKCVPSCHKLFVIYGEEVSNGDTTFQHAMQISTVKPKFDDWYVSCFSIEIFPNNSRKLLSANSVLFSLCCSLTYNIRVLSVALSHFLSLLSKIWCRRTNTIFYPNFFSKLF